MRILFYDKFPERSEFLRKALTEAGHEVKILSSKDTSSIPEGPFEFGDVDLAQEFVLKNFGIALFLCDTYEQLVSRGTHGFTMLFPSIPGIFMERIEVLKSM